MRKINQHMFKICLWVSLSLLVFSSHAQEKHSFGDLPMASITDFPGGAQGMKKYVSENICYPAKALANREDGTVFVEIMIDSMGMITQAQLRAGVCKDIDSLCLAVVKAMPAWKPNGERFRQYMLPIRFYLYYKNTGTHYPAACDERKKPLLIEKTK